MEIQVKENQLTDIEKKFYFPGAIGLAGLFLFTIILGGLFSPLTLLRIRLFFVGTAFGYFLTIHFYQLRSIKKQLETLDQKPTEVIIWFNGKELEGKY
ncbi:hypothetical protein RJD24_20780 [Bacillaceae bacterium IKA-2]|nr:hypothetical protein RJD24_20780 [Bacillaceae bacterium IKA-2]